MADKAIRGGATTGGEGGGGGTVRHGDKGTQCSLFSGVSGFCRVSHCYFFCVFTFKATRISCQTANTAEDMHAPHAHPTSPHPMHTPPAPTRSRPAHQEDGEAPKLKRHGSATATVMPLTGQTPKRCWCAARGCGRVQAAQHPPSASSHGAGRGTAARPRQSPAAAQVYLLMSTLRVLNRSQQKAI